MLFVILVKLFLLRKNHQPILLAKILYQNIFAFIKRKVKF